MGQRRRARECALQMLFQIDLTGALPCDVFEQFWTAQPVGEDLRIFAESLVAGVERERRFLDQAIAFASEHWRLERMAAVDRNVLRMAVYEMLCEPDTPAAVVMDEAIEIAKRFGGEDSGAFVNGILDAVHKRIVHGEIQAPPDRNGS